MAGEKLHRSTKRVFDILEQISQGPAQGMTLTELSVAMAAPKSSLFPIVHTLHDLHMVALNEETGRYTIGYKTFELGNYYVGQGGFLQDVKERMEKIVRHCKETCYFAQLVEGDVFYIHKVDSPEPVRSVVSPGQRLPAYTTGIGKALLSDKTKAELESFYPDGLKALTPNTIVNMDQLAFQLEEIRRNGLAFECEESTEYIRCVAVPLKKGDKVFAAMSVAVPIFRYDPEKESTIIKHLRQSQVELEAILKNSNITTLS